MDKAGAECANLTVPLDYAVPQGRTITVAMSRLQATDTRRRIGSILINNGNACIDHEVNQYLTSGKLPARDETCETQGT